MCDLNTQKFPNDLISTKLALLHQSVPGIVFHDDYGIDATSKDLINDIEHLRESLRKELPSDWYNDKGLLRPDVASIATISLSGYYFLVGLFAITALGGNCVPLRESFLARLKVQQDNGRYLSINSSPSKWCSS
jgi:malonyl-CoA/methylmalonyl-CoA synthetase